LLSSLIGSVEPPAQPPAAVALAKVTVTRKGMAVGLEGTGSNDTSPAPRHGSGMVVGMGSPTQGSPHVADVPRPR